jgi:hypothetical protein
LPLESTAFSDGDAQEAKPENRLEKPAAKPRGVLGAACLIPVGILLCVALIVGGLWMISLAGQQGGSPAVAFELVGTSTPYPTATPYRTAALYRTPAPYRVALPYKTATIYPTDAPYPTTGVIERPPQRFVPSSLLGGCRLNVKNLHPALDAVIVLSKVDPQEIEKAVYVRSNDSFSESGIPTGVYYIFVSLGLDWDSHTNSFVNNAAYFRFKEPVTFDQCPYAVFQGYQYVDVTINPEGERSNIIDLPPESFPSLAR